MMTEYLSHEEIKSEEQASRVLRGFWGAVSSQAKQIEIDRMADED